MLFLALVYHVEWVIARDFERHAIKVWGQDMGVLDGGRKRWDTGINDGERSLSDIDKSLRFSFGSGMRAVITDTRAGFLREANLPCPEEFLQGLLHS
jgi:hypothetical protein